MFNDQGSELKPIFGPQLTNGPRWHISWLAISENLVSARMLTGVSAVVRKKKPAHLPCAL
jgi:hypothetical protein